MHRVSVLREASARCTLDLIGALVCTEMVATHHLIFEVRNGSLYLFLISMIGGEVEVLISTEGGEQAKVTPRKIDCESVSRAEAVDRKRS